MLTLSWRQRLSVLVVIGLTVCGWCPAQDNKADPAKPKAAVPVPKITVSKETTWATEPLRADGSVDYLEAVNRLFSKDVKPENNACVLLYQAMGPSPEGGKGQPDFFFRRMGSEPLPPNGSYFQSLGTWARAQPTPPQDNNALNDMQSKSAERPWTKAEFPLIAEWLKQNEVPLRTIELATERPKYFSPLVGTDAEPDGALIAVLLPGVQKSRDLARALASRAMWELAEGSQDDAWRDLMTMHRLGRLVGQGPTLIEYLVGVAIESIAIKGELLFLSETKSSAKMLAMYRKQLDHLPPRASVADKLDSCERVMFLDCAQRMARGQMKWGEIANLAEGGDGSLVEKLAEGVIMQSVDWDVVLKSANKWYDRLAATLRKPDYRERTAEVKQFNEDVKKLVEKSRAPQALQSLLGGKPAISQTMSDALIALLLPAVQQVGLAEGRAIQRMRNMEIAFALAAYRAERDSYPDSLELLAPKYMAEIPNDLLTGRSLKYSKTADGYLLHSVGDNEQDEEGRSFDDIPPGDDLVVRMPVPKNEKAK